MNWGEDKMTPDGVVWFRRVRAALVAKGLDPDAEHAFGLAAGLMFNERAARIGCPGLLDSYLEPIARQLGIELAEVFAVKES